ncbi:MAG TPA: hypothetical protein VM328_13000 [Fimbriimonadaceae bacterium]|nr:hypothetical protein [Fimbriimonadaceae bacterium]
MLIDTEDYLDILTELTEAAITGLTTSSPDRTAEEIAEKAVAIANQAAYAILAKVAEAEDFGGEEDEEEEAEEDEESEEEEGEENEEAGEQEETAAVSG